MAQMTDIFEVRATEGVLVADCVRAVANSFCSTGPGGGIDPSCGRKLQPEELRTVSRAVKYLGPAASVDSIADESEMDVDTAKAAIHQLLIEGRISADSEGRLSHVEEQTVKPAASALALTDSEKRVLENWVHGERLVVAELQDAGDANSYHAYNAVRSIMDRSPEYSGPVYRGLALGSDASQQHRDAVAALTTPGAIVELGHTASWTKSTGIAAGFAEGIKHAVAGDRVLLELGSRKSKAVDMSDYMPDSKHQQEVMVDGYNRGDKLKYRVESVSSSEHEVHDYLTGRPTGRAVKTVHVRLTEV